jgi:pimeloyl-ACP methyl ester carboxylesterase
MLETAGAEIAYDVRGPLPTVDGRPPLFMIGQPMTAGGFDTLASHFPDRTVVTYDPRGLGRSVRREGRADNAPTVQADDVHAVIEALGAGPVAMFASSGGAVTALALVAAYPDDVTTLVAAILGSQQLPPRRRRAGRGADARRHRRRRGIAGHLHRTHAVATAELLAQQATVFPSHHGGFLGGEFGYAGQPEAFARKLREVLHDD